MRDDVIPAQEVNFRIERGAIGIRSFNNNENINFNNRFNDNKDGNFNNNQNNDFVNDYSSVRYHWIEIIEK